MGIDSSLLKNYEFGQLIDDLYFDTGQIEEKAMERSIAFWWWQFCSAEVANYCFFGVTIR